MSTSAYIYQQIEECGKGERRYDTIHDKSEIIKKVTKVNITFHFEAHSLLVLHFLPHFCILLQGAGEFWGVNSE